MSEENYRLRKGDFKLLFAGLKEYDKRVYGKHTKFGEIDLRAEIRRGFLFSYQLGTIILPGAAIGLGLEHLLR